MHITDADICGHMLQPQLERVTYPNVFQHDPRVHDPVDQPTGGVVYWAVQVAGNPAEVTQDHAGQLMHSFISTQSLPVMRGGNSEADMCTCLLVMCTRLLGVEVVLQIVVAVLWGNPSSVLPNISFNFAYCFISTLICIMTSFFSFQSKNCSSKKLKLKFLDQHAPGLGFVSWQVTQYFTNHIYSQNKHSGSACWCRTCMNGLKLSLQYMINSSHDHTCWRRAYLSVSCIAWNYRTRLCPRSPCCRHMRRCWGPAQVVFGTVRSWLIHDIPMCRETHTNLPNLPCAEKHTNLPNLPKENHFLNMVQCTTAHSDTYTTALIYIARHVSESVSSPVAWIKPSCQPKGSSLSSWLTHLGFES
jgi:hypothetical protein